MGQILDKRTADNRLYDIDCSRLLQAGETITSVSSVSSALGGMQFGAGAPNTAPITYPDGRTVAAGLVCQVRISGGTIPPGSDSLQCIVRALLVTTLNPALEATVLLRLVDKPNI